MISHEPKEYLCPFCDWLSGNETEYKQNGDIVYQDENITAFIAPKWWVNNPGHVIVIPNRHSENLYSITDELLSQVYAVVKKMGIAIRETYDCTGISTRQHNEPDGNQDGGIFTFTYIHATKTTDFTRITITRDLLVLKNVGRMP